MKINDINHFIFEWHSFPIDYWWRKKYSISFGSQQHRNMNFIDMLIDWQEELNINKEISNAEKINNSSNEQIDKDFDELDLSTFDKK